MSYREWGSSNGMGRLRVYSDNDLYRFDKLRGSMAFRYENVMIEYEDYRTNQRTTIIAERCFIWEDENHVYLQLSGRKIVHTEPLRAQRRHRISGENRRAIEVYSDF